MIERYLSREELARLVSALVLVVTFIAIFALFAFLVVPSMRNANKPVSGPAVDAPQGESGWLDPTDYPPQRGYTVPPVDPKTVMTATPAMLTRGQVVFNQTCAPCHGAEGHGDGAAAGGLKPPPRNFAQKDGWKNGYKIEDIYKTLDEGIKGSAMVSYNYISRKDRMALVHYVQSLGTFDHGPEDPKALEALAKSFSASAEVVPDRIPVTSAMKHIEGEYVGAPTLTGLSSGSDLLRASVTDAGAAARTLAGIPNWSKDDAALAKAISAGLPANGFSPAVATYTAQEWKALQAELMNMGAR
jgi:mono/diheme cytochrome c family protein